MREAVRPFITDELYRRKKSQYNVPLAPPLQVAPTGAESEKRALTPLEELVQSRVTKENVERLGWMNWAYVEPLLTDFIGTAAYPSDGGLDKRGRKLLAILSFVTLGERFKVPTWSL